MWTAHSTWATACVFGGVSDSALRQMSDDTGGHVFHIDRKLTLQDAFRELQDEMRSQYAIGYTPTNAAKDGTFRRIDIRTAIRTGRCRRAKAITRASTAN